MPYFNSIRRILIVCLVGTGLCSSSLAAGDDNNHAIRDLYIVAHQDDTLLFMVPDLQKAIDAGHTVKTVFVTAGFNNPVGTSDESAAGGSDRTGSTNPYYLDREAAAMAAYATLAGVSNNWALKETEKDEGEDDDDKPVREIVLVDRPNISLVFFRLPIGLISGVPSGDKEFAETLRTLWIGEAQTITALDHSAIYTKDQLVRALAKLIRSFRPASIATQDTSGFNGTGEDPSGLNILYIFNPGDCDFYDNSDHYYSAVFAMAAEQLYEKPHALLQYRGYNIGNEAPNVFGADLAKKKRAFQAYSEIDLDIFAPQSPFCSTTPGPACLYDNWVERQYRVDAKRPANGIFCKP